MNVETKPGRTGILLSFNRDYADLARQIASDLNAANIDVRFDPWDGGGGVPARQTLAGRLDDVTCVLPLLTPSATEKSWVGEGWRRAIHEAAQARGVAVLPVLGDGDARIVPHFLQGRSFANLCSRDCALEFRRLVETIRRISGDTQIRLPEGGREAAAAATTSVTDPIVIELGGKLAPMFEGTADALRFSGDAIPMMYDGLFYLLGVQFPELQVRVSSEVPASSVRILIHGIPETQADVHPGCVMVNDTVHAMSALGFTAVPAINPATGAPSAWIAAECRAAVEGRGFTTWDAHEFVMLTVGSVLQRKAGDFIGTDETAHILENVALGFPLLVAETAKTVPLVVLTDVLRRLLAEMVGIRNMRQILLSLVEWGTVEKDPVMLTEYVRAKLKRQLTHQFSHGTRELVVLLLDPELEALLEKSVRHTRIGTYLELESAQVRDIVTAIRERVDALPKGARMPQILTVMAIRSALRRLVAPVLPLLHVISYQELDPDVMIQPIGRISLTGFTPRRNAKVGEVTLWGS